MKRQMFMGGRHINPWPLLSKVACPVLVVEGEKSENKGLVDIRRAVSLFSQGQYKSVAQAGHLIPMQKPQDVVRIIQDFITEHENPRRKQCVSRRSLPICNQKGGVGKTTCALNIAAGLTLLGKKILVVDFDPQAHLTYSVGIDNTKSKRLFIR